MYNSLKAWCKQDITVIRQGKLLPSGEHGESERFTVKGLLVDDSKLIQDKNGQLITCRSYVYVIPTRKIEESDKIIIPGEKAEFEIRRLGGYYDGNDGALSVQVVYL